MKAKPPSCETIKHSAESATDAGTSDERVGMDGGMKPDEIFINWLKQRRLAEEEAAKKGGVKNREKAEARLTAAMLGAKVKEVLADDNAMREAERKCKWFILWNERYSHPCLISSKIS